MRISQKNIGIIFVAFNFMLALLSSNDFGSQITPRVNVKSSRLQGLDYLKLALVENLAKAKASHSKL